MRNIFRLLFKRGSQKNPIISNKMEITPVEESIKQESSIVMDEDFKSDYDYLLRDISSIHNELVSSKNSNYSKHLIKKMNDLEEEQENSNWISLFIGDTLDRDEGKILIYIMPN